MQSSTDLPATSRPLRLQVAGTLALLLLLALAIFWPVGSFEAINFDDPRYVMGNERLRQGLTWENVRWALEANFTRYEKGVEYWQPLTTLSRIFDTSLFGVHAGRFHIMSAAIHWLNAGLLLAALYRLSCRWNVSAVVALLFLVHPLNVEAACWLSARKDLLNATFFFLLVWAYAHYAERPSWPRYGLVVSAFLGSLMAKPMAVTFPFVLLLLDLWPLRRWWSAHPNQTLAQHRRWLVLEKLPLLILAALGALLAIEAQRNHAALHSLDHVSLYSRVAGAAVGIATSLRRVFFPVDLACTYPHPRDAIALSWAAVSCLLLVVISVVAWWRRRSDPQLLAGWIWYLLLMVPVCGLVSIGHSLTADRYFYLSGVGIFVALVWTAATYLPRRWPAILAILAIGGAAVVAYPQVLTWRDTGSVFWHASTVTKKNGLALYKLANWNLSHGDLNGAEAAFTAALECPEVADFATPGYLVVMLAKNRYAEAEQRAAAFLQKWPFSPVGHWHLGHAQLAQKKYAEAEISLKTAMQRAPGEAQVYTSLQRLYRETGRVDEAQKIVVPSEPASPDQKAKPLLPH